MLSFLVINFYTGEGKMLRNILVSLVAILCLTQGAFAAKSEKKDLYGDINVRYRDASTGGNKYAGLRGELSFLNWTNTYKDQDGIKLGSDDFNFKPLIGLSVFGGFKPIDKWRTDIEISYIGKYNEAETENDGGYMKKTYFDMVVYNLSVNGYYDFYKGFYAGVGAGIAVVKTTLDDTDWQRQSSTDISPMGALMAGWSVRVDEKIDFDLRYRMALFHGGEVEFANLKIEEGLITDISLSAGIRYNF